MPAVRGPGQFYQARMSVSRNRIRFLENALLLYRALLSQIDQLCDHIVESSPDAIVCRAGCSGCCQLEGALPVEAAHLFIAWHALPSHR